MARVARDSVSEGYAAVESANFWAAAGDWAAEHDALQSARDCFRRARKKGAKQLARDVDTRIRERERTVKP